MEILANVNMQGLRHFAEWSALLGLLWQGLRIVALYYGIRLIMAITSYVSAAEKKVGSDGPTATQAGEVVSLLRSIELRLNSVEEYLEHGAIKKF